MRVLSRIAILLLAVSLTAPVAARAAAPLDFSLDTRDISIGADYNGTVLRVDGKAPAGSDVVVRVLGAAGDQHLKQKGRALGLLWMNMGSLTLRNVPSLYLVFSSRPVADLGPAARGLGLEGVRDGLQVEPASADTPAIRAEFLGLKTSEGLYRESAGGIELGVAEGAIQPFEARLSIPSRLAPGTYTVEVTALRDGQVLAQSGQEVRARLTGAPAMLSDMAFGHAALYGILATIIAILAGLGIGLVFQSKGAH